MEQYGPLSPHPALIHARTHIRTQSSDWSDPRPLPHTAHTAALIAPPAEHGTSHPSPNTHITTHAHAHTTHHTYPHDCTDQRPAVRHPSPKPGDGAFGFAGKAEDDSNPATEGSGSTDSAAVRANSKKEKSAKKKSKRDKGKGKEKPRLVIGGPTNFVHVGYGAQF